MLVGKGRMGAASWPIGLRTWLPPRKVCLRITAHHHHSATRLAVLPLRAKGLHPPIHAQAPVMDQDVAVPERAQYRRAAGDGSVEDVFASRCVRREVVHMQAYAPRNSNDH